MAAYGSCSGGGYDGAYIPAAFHHHHPQMAPAAGSGAILPMAHVISTVYQPIPAGAAAAAAAAAAASADFYHMDFDPRLPYGVRGAPNDWPPAWSPPTPTWPPACLPPPPPAPEPHTLSLLAPKAEETQQPVVRTAAESDTSRITLLKVARRSGSGQHGPKLRRSRTERPPSVTDSVASTCRPFACHLCGKAFSQAANLTAHRRVHTGEKPFSCSVCHRPFSQSSSLVTHRRTHSGERPYACPHCEKCFTDSSTLTKHLRTHTGQKPYACPLCLMRFTQSGNLHRHMKTHRPGDTGIGVCR